MVGLDGFTISHTLENVNVLGTIQSHSSLDHASCPK